MWSVSAVCESVAKSRIIFQCWFARIEKKLDVPHSFPKNTISSRYLSWFSPFLFILNPCKFQIYDLKFHFSLTFYSVVCSVAWIIGCFFFAPFLRACTWAKDNFSSFFFCWKFRTAFTDIDFHVYSKRNIIISKRISICLRKKQRANAMANVKAITKAKEPNRKHE